MQAVEWSDSDQKFAEAHLRIVTGLYGLLRPFDDVKPVRDVPIGAKLQTKRGKTVCQFWIDLITKQLAKDIVELAKRGAQKTLLVVNLSDEYWAAVHNSGLPSGVEVVRVLFQGGSEDSVRRARGLLASHVVRKCVTDMEGLRDFSHDDWAFDRSVSRDTKVVFTWDGSEAGADKTASKVKVKKAAAADPGYHSSGSSGGEEPAQQASKSSGGCRDSRSLSRSCSQRRPHGGASTRNKKRGGTTRCPSSRSRSSSEKPARRGHRRDSRSRSRSRGAVKRSRR